MHIALVHVECAEGGVLCHIARVVRCLPLNFADDFGYRGGGGIVTDSPAGHAMRFRKTVNHNCAFGHSGEHCGACKFRIVDKVFINFVRDAVDVLRDNFFC